MIINPEMTKINSESNMSSGIKRLYDSYLRYLEGKQVDSKRQELFEHANKCPRDDCGYPLCNQTRAIIHLKKIHGALSEKHLPFIV